ncbi:uncharacterized protein FOMMEDRAFT_141603 [Fomitiporia mediterranea MF3/22]|uniref:uncharacterized protein n=1 Tax=Fomitiporia mediterranea (strain MF3/22) TaxID=694068 RepID=UPI00044091AD|nr:uncharacterized protein FOMMEDRAFT_141603 [Fomitiporia mediterranea MF3/22]EJD00790.1 hypothetical protein FOMMEDRAFT_141603 [Fomitiporia mediterranea MF3/22]
MDLLSKYEALSVTSQRTDVATVLRSIINGSFLLPNNDRDRLVGLLLHDVEAALDRSDKKARLSRKDAGLALLALKTLGRAPAASDIIARESNLRILLSTTKSLRSSDTEAADDALRCVANALLLVERGRETWVDIHGGAYCVDLLEKAQTPTLVFLCSRILFLSTASPTSALLPALLGRHSISFSFPQRIMEKNGNQDVVVIVSKQLDFLLNGVLVGTPMSKEAMTDLLKFSFNLLCHWPKIAPDAEDVRPRNGNGNNDLPPNSVNSHIDNPVLGERWSRRLDGFLPALRRVFLNLPPMSPSPLTAPVTHVLHALLPIPIDEKLYSVWFPEGNEGSSGRSTPRSTNSSPTTGEAHPRISCSSDSPTSGPSTTTTRSSKEKEGPLDRALSMLTPRLSLSRSPSPVSPVARDSISSEQHPSTSPSTAGPVTPKFIQRGLDLLDVSLAHYLPGNVDPDDASVKNICSDEDVVLDHILSPLVLLLNKLCKGSGECRRAVCSRVLPVDLDRTKPLEGRADTLGRCLRLMACVQHQQLKDGIGELVFVVCDSDATVMSTQIGYGNAAGYLFNRGILSAPPSTSVSTSSTSSTSSASASISSISSTNSSGPSLAISTASAEEEEREREINPITGMLTTPRPPSPQMTEEEKEREAEKLFVLFERLEKAGGMENPIKKALREGRLEKYEEERRRMDERGGEDDLD